MILVDVNIPIHAVSGGARGHDRLRAWWDERLSSASPIAIPWAVSFGFVRIMTNPRIVQPALDVDEALACVASWFAQPCVRVIEPLDGHWELAASLLHHAGAAANLTTDAHLAALAIQHGCELCSTDTDFARFPGLRWHNPLDPAGAR